MDELVTAELIKLALRALLPAIVAIVLALISKEVYSSLFVGIVTGGVIYAAINGPVEQVGVGALEHVFKDGIIASLSDPYNVGILVFLVFLGIIVALMNKAGGSAAFGNWASEHVHSRVGSQLATIGLGVLIFIDDYFNCLTVGSVILLLFLHGPQLFQDLLLKILTVLCSLSARSLITITHSLPL